MRQATRATVGFALATLLLAACHQAGGEQTAPVDEGVKTAHAPRTAPVNSPTLKAVQARGRVDCGVHQGLPGFAYPDTRGAWRGFDADFCRAVAAAVLGDANAVRFAPLSAGARFTALQTGRIDLLSRNTSWTFSRDAGMGLDFVGVSYHDGQGFLAQKALNLQSATELSGARVCVEAGTTTEQMLAEWFGSKGIAYKPVVAESEEKARLTYDSGGCDVFSADISALAAARSVLNNPGAHVILPDVISKEPLGPVVRQGDDQWEDIVRWTLNTMILAEELGVTSKTVDKDRKESSVPEVRRLLGEGGYGHMLGLKDDWAYQVIKQVGNYGEVFDRNLGSGSALKLERGLNAQWNAARPGLLYAPPMR